MDVAALSLSIDSSSVVSAANDLDKFTAAAKRAGAAAGGATKMGQDYARSAGQVDQFSNSAAKAAAAAQSAARFAQYGASNIQATGQASQLAAHHVQNLFYQLNDVFVSVMSGQKPLTVFIQQGSQIGQIYSQTGLTLKGFALGLADMLGILKTTTAATEALALAEAQQATASLAAANSQATANVRAAETNIAVAEAQAAMATTATEAAAAQARLTIATSSLAAAQSEAAITAAALETAMAAEGAAATEAAAATTVALTPLAIILAGVVAAVALLTAGLAALTSQANDDSGLKKYTTAMGYTKAEVEKLNAVTVTWGDTAKAVFQVGWERIASAFGVTTDDLSKKWSEFTDWLVTAIRAGLAGVYAALTGAQNIIPRLIDNIKTGRKENLFELVGGSFKDQYKDAQKFMDDVVGQARKNARARQDAMATKMYDAPSTPKGRHEYDFSDLMKDADKQRNDLTKAGAQIGVYGEELARVTYQQDLLNKAQEHGLKLTPEQTAKVNELAASLAALSEQNRHAKFMEDFNQQTVQQIASLEQARGAIGLTGAALASYTYEQNQLNKAIAEHITLTDADRQKISQDAVKVGDATYQNIRDKSASDNARSHADAMRQLDVEREAIGLTGEALIAYNYQQELINKALQEGVAFKDIDIEKTKRQADAYAQVRYAMDQQKQAMADAREVTKGFFEDWINSVREGGNLFKAFADAVVNSLNRIIDKLLDRTLNGFLDSLFSGGGGGGLFSSIFGGGSSSKGLVSSGSSSVDWTSVVAGTKWANGGAFGTPTRFANGGAFTNSIVNTPTLFRFANGAAMGEMGEAGPEAIMPLKRGANGALGVQAHGGGSRKADIKIQQNFNMEGVMTPNDVAAMVRQGSAAAVQEVRRNLDAYLQEWQIDGAVST